jgi:drug/metabolite transporter (DMT)-like permease
VARTDESSPTPRLLHRGSAATVGVSLVLLAAACFGSMPVLARIAYESGADTYTFLACRFVICSVLLWLWVLWQHAPLPRGSFLRAVVLLGAIGYSGQSVTYFLAVRWAPITVAAPLNYSYPIFVVLLAKLTKGERLTGAKTAAVFLAVLGAALTADAGGHIELAGAALALASGVIYSIYLTICARVLPRGSSIGATVVTVTATAVVFSTISLARAAHSRLPGDATGWAATAAVAVLTAVGIFFLFEGVQRIKPVTTAVASVTEPVVAVLLAVAFLGEVMTLEQVIGFVLVVAAVVTARTSLPGSFASAGASGFRHSEPDTRNNS